MASEIVVRVEGQRFALPLRAVNRVIRAVEVTPVSTAPDIFLGVVDFGGEVLPVVDLRLRLSVDRRPVDVDDCMVVVQTSLARLVLLVDEVIGVDEALNVPLEPEGGPISADCIDRILADSDGLVPELDIDRIVTPEEYAEICEQPADGDTG